MNRKLLTAAALLVTPLLWSSVASAATMIFIGDFGDRLCSHYHR
jgi:hypothetical protein